MPGEFGDSPGKRAVRELWNTPLLRYLHDSYQIRYRYMGLPGVELLDVQLWRDMIDEVIAFEIRAKPEAGDLHGRRHILELRRNLRRLNSIRSQAYFGPLEEVVILREDYDGTPYNQENVVTLYNLDFCDEIVSKIATRRQGRKVWRFDAIRQILVDQREHYRRVGGQRLFVILLTVRNQVDASRFMSLLSENLYVETQRYVDTCNTAGPTPLPAAGSLRGTHTWVLKAFLHNTIRQYLSAPNISAVFFPTVKYTGKTERSPMFHSMMLCRFGDPERSSPGALPRDYLTDITSVRAHDDYRLVWDPEPGEIYVPSGVPSSDSWFQTFEPAFMQ